MRGLHRQKHVGRLRTLERKLCMKTAAKGLTVGWSVPPQIDEQAEGVEALRLPHLPHSAALMRILYPDWSGAKSYESWQRSCDGNDDAVAPLPKLAQGEYSQPEVAQASFSKPAGDIWQLAHRQAHHCKSIALTTRKDSLECYFGETVVHSNTSFVPVFPLVLGVALALDE